LQIADFRLRIDLLLNPQSEICNLQ